MNSVLYRKYRPATFGDVVGQDHIVDVLKASIKNDSISHAYLFSGDRGTGKTSIARIFAKELKCSPVDINEIDAASHTSVEDIRDINDSVARNPLESEYKIYILDEAHMLSKSAFNALLKTLEEPTKSTIFILATTEMGKIPETISSRCQIFSFKSPTVQVLKKVIKDVVKKEGYEMDVQSLNLIALLSNGSFRDALSILQKVMTVSDSKNINHDMVEEVLGAPKSGLVNGYIKAVVEGNAVSGREVIQTCIDNGIDMKVFTTLCIRKVRALLFNSLGDKTLIEEFSEDDREDMSVSFELLDGLLKAYTDIEFVNIKQLPLEVLLISFKTNG